MRKKLLWIGDACVSSGFARATHHTLDVMRHTFDVAVIGLNYTGDPHGYPYPVYPAFVGGDGFGVGRVKELIRKFAPDVIVLQQDPWNFPSYMKEVAGAVPVIGAVAVDGKNCRGKDLNGLALAVFWTEFGVDQAALGGYTGDSAVIPLGVDLATYRVAPDRLALRKQIWAMGQINQPIDSFVVGVVGRNQPRKRLDLTIEYFAEWVRSRAIENVLLWMHVAPTGEAAYDLVQLADYYGVLHRLMIPAIGPIHGLSENGLACSYNCFDVLLSTTQGEGMWLPGLEAAACGVPIVAPRWSAIEELFDGAACLVDCPTTAATINGINAIGGIADKQGTVLALDALYQRPELRAHCRERGLALAAQDRFRWPNIGRAFTEAVERVLAGHGRPEQPASGADVAGREKTSRPAGSLATDGRGEPEAASKQDAAVLA